MSLPGGALAGGPCLGEVPWWSMRIFTICKRSYGKVRFSQVCVKNSVHMGRGGIHPSWADIPQGRHPSTLEIAMQRTVRIVIPWRCGTSLSHLAWFYSSWLHSFQPGVFSQKPRRLVHKQWSFLLQWHHIHVVVYVTSLCRRFYCRITDHYCYCFLVY